MQSPDPRQLDVNKTKTEIDHIYRRLSAFTQAQLELRKQTISDEELAEFELSLQNWVVDYLWPAKKHAPVQIRSRDFVISTNTAKRNVPLPFTKRAWEITLFPDFLGVQVADSKGKLLVNEVDYRLAVSGVTLLVYVFRNPGPAVSITPSWEDPDQPGTYTVSAVHGYMVDPVSIIFS